jgi:beta-lactamase class A
MPGKRWQRVLVWVGAGVFVVVVAFQLAWPADRGLPLARVNDKSLALASFDEMASSIVVQFDASRVELKVGDDKSIEVGLKDIGAEPNTEKMIERLRGYPWWARLIPGSILLQPAQIEDADVYYAYEKFKKFTEKAAQELTFEAQNARLEVKDGHIVTKDAIASSEISSEELQAIVSGARLAIGRVTVIDVPSRREAAERTSKDLASVRDEAEAILAHKVTIAAGDQKFSPERKEIASWVVLATADDGSVTLSIDQEKIKAYLSTINEKVGVPAGQTDITIVDGREVGRVEGVMGRTIDSDVLARQVAEVLMKPEMTVELTAQFIDQQPSVIYNSRYTTSEAGLRAYVNDVAHSRNMWISIVQLNGEKWTAGAREHESIPSGSTYKLYVALVLFDKINKGEIHWDDPMLDTTVAGCFERMTVASTNPCAESWIAQFGRQYINDFIWARGFSTGTSFTTGWANQTTAADLTKYMIGLYNGSLVSGANRDRLWDSLGRHPYPYGIPTGSAGVVHNKVGFLWGYVHDAAVVEHPRGTYVMTIMTNGGSYAPIASVTREIERIMYP